jgi:hypothetical protein
LLATRRPLTIGFLSPLQFSLDTGIDQETALALFAYCTQPDIMVLRVKYCVTCNRCDHVNGCYYRRNEIPTKITCLGCEREENFDEDMIRIWFELIQEPIGQPLEPIPVMEYFEGKSIASVRPH